MAKYVMQAFEKQVIDLDDNEYLSCSFRDCVFRYSGGNVNMEDCDFQHPSWQMRGHAAATIGFVGMLLNAAKKDDTGLYNTIRGWFGIEPVEVKENGSV